MQKTPESLRIHIGFFGQRNVGKSSLLNALANQEISIVSDTPGTTTDPVKKAMELIPLGPVLFIDTAGLDDIGSLGAAVSKRVHANILPGRGVRRLRGARRGFHAPRRGRVCARGRRVGRPRYAGADDGGPR